MRTIILTALCFSLFAAETPELPADLKAKVQNYETKVQELDKTKQDLIVTLRTAAESAEEEVADVIKEKLYELSPSDTPTAKMMVGTWQLIKVDKSSNLINGMKIIVNADGTCQVNAEKGKWTTEGGVASKTKKLKFNFPAAEDGSVMVDAVAAGRKNVWKATKLK